MAAFQTSRRPGREVFFDEPNGARDLGEGNGSGAEAFLRQLLEGLRGWKQGNLAVRVTSPGGGLLGELAEAFNGAIQLNEATANEVMRISKVVGEEGRLTQRAAPTSPAGAWAKEIESLNFLIDSLAQPTTEVGRVITAVAQGDLGKKMELELEGRPLKGEFLRIGTIVNTMVDQLGSFASEVTRVAREVGTEGKLGGQAAPAGVVGSWKDSIETFNLMVRNVTFQVRETKEVTAAVARGDLSKRYVGEAKGEFNDMKNVLNGKVDMLNSVASEVTRLSREVGQEGRLGGQVRVNNVEGVWKELGEYMNIMVRNVAAQVRETREVTAAVARGDLSKRYTGEAHGEFQEMKNVLNGKVDMLNSVASELTRLAREVGQEGKLGGQAVVRDVAGVWKELTDSVNMVAGNLTLQLRDVSKVATAIARGDLSQKITVDVKGEIMDVKNSINLTVDQLNSFASEVTRVAREVGTEGRLGVVAKVEGVGGTWRDLTDSVNAMAGNLTVQLRDVSKVATAIAKGDLSQKITVDVRGEILQIKETINTMVDQLNSFASEVTRVAREVGTEGKLGGQADVKGVAGTWKNLTDNVNAMAGNLTIQLRDVSKVATAIASGDLTQKITVDVRGEILQIKDVINKMVDQLNTFAGEVTRVAREVGTEGKLGGQAEVKGVAGTWKDLTDNVNAMAGNLTVQLRDVSKVATAIASGDLTQKITVDVRGEILQIKDVINKMVDQLNTFAGEVTRVAREVGTEGKLGGQAEVKGVAGTWKDLTDNVNAMAGNLTVQLRDVSKVATAIASGDLTQKITVDVRGEILQIKDVINKMVDQLNTFAGEVTRVAREVGTEGKLGGQADVKGVAGTWKNLTDNVNAMAGNLTVQLRDVSKVATAIASGDLTQKITVDVRGEILQIKDVINRMVDQLNTFAGEVTRVAREVGTEGKLGGQAEVKGVAGTWKDLTDNVNAMAQSLTVQVRDIARVTAAIAQGKLDQKITVEAEGEILQLKNTINGMVDNLSTIIGDINAVMGLVGEGTLSRLIEVKAAGEFAAMVEGINGTIESLRGIVTELTEAGVNIGSVSQVLLSAGQEMNGMVSQLSTSMEQIADGAKGQAQQIAEASRESEGVGRTASNTLERSEGMNKMTDVATRAAGEGSKAMAETIRNTDLMLQGSQESVTSIDSLSKSSEQIQEIVDVIRDIATQTNILAINAAIEAVRAGRQGKGFAVVAEEVKTLSAESKEQAKKISGLVQSVLKETQDTVTTIKTMAENVTKGKKSIEETSKAFVDINQTVESTSKTGKEISVAAGDQKRSIDAISQSLDKISGIAADTSTASTQSADGAKKLLSKTQELTTTATNLANMSEKFLQTVGRFTIAEDGRAKKRQLARPVTAAK